MIYVTTRFFARELKGDFVRSDHDSFSAWEFVKVTC